MIEHSVLLRFSYFEHDWDEAIDGPEAAEAELLRRAAADWQQVEGEEPPDEFDTLDELAQRLEEVLIGEWQVPAQAATLPLDSLRAIIIEGGWTFHAGEFMEFEGHHNDTKMLVKLVRTA